MHGVRGVSISELAVGLALVARRGLLRWVCERRWRAAPTHALADLRVLVVGAGTIGEAARPRLAPFETEIMRVVATARDDEYGYIHDVDEPPELFPNTDILVLIVPLTDSIHGLIGAKELTLLPDSTLMASVVRGPVVDIDAITAEVVADRLRMTSDVFDPKPLPDDHSLWQADGTSISPRIGGNTAAMLPRTVALLANQLPRLADGRELKFAVKSRAAPWSRSIRPSDCGSLTTAWRCGCSATPICLNISTY